MPVWVLFTALTILLPPVVVMAGAVYEEPLRIFTGGIRHESNTFIPVQADKDVFVVQRGEEALHNQLWADYLKSEGVEIIASLHAYARPYGVVARQTYEAFKEEILEGARRAGKVDGVYLDLHGAMHVEGYDDAQLDLIRAVREILGEDVLVSASFDLHGNLSQEFIDELDILANMRTAPHTDGPETRERAVRLLVESLRQGWQPVIAHLNIPVIIPGEKGITSVEPLKSLYESLPLISEKPGFLEASIFVGMPWTDVYRAGMSVQVVARSVEYEEKALEQVRQLAMRIWEQRYELKFDVPTDDIDGAIQTALRSRSSTVFITDSGDNTTAGAAGDGTLVLSKLIEHQVPDAVLAGIVDPEAVEKCMEAGLGNVVRMYVGGKIDRIYSEPYFIEGIVRTIKRDRPVPGSPARARRLSGDAAVVDLGGVLLVLLSERQSFTSPGHFYDVEIDPLEHKIVVVKLGYLFQALREIAPETIMALTPGFAYQVVENLEYHQLRRPIFPMDADMEWNPRE